MYKENAEEYIYYKKVGGRSKDLIGILWIIGWMDRWMYNIIQ
jgi:hypothetical protein